MKSRDVGSALALVSMPVCLLGTLACSVGGYIHAMVFWCLAFWGAFCVVGILADPHESANRKRTHEN